MDGDVAELPHTDLDAIECAKTCRYAVAAVEGQKVDTVGVAVLDLGNQCQQAGLINLLVGVVVIGLTIFATSD